MREGKALGQNSTEENGEGMDFRQNGGRYLLKTCCLVVLGSVLGTFPVKHRFETTCQ